MILKQLDPSPSRATGLIVKLSLYFEPRPNLSKTLEGLLTSLVIFVNTIFQLNSRNITVSVCCVSEFKVNRKERSGPAGIKYRSLFTGQSTGHHDKDK